MNELVFEQWLLSDLHELGTKCLPGQLVNSDKYQLNGTFALQVYVNEYINGAKYLDMDI